MTNAIWKNHPGTNDYDTGSNWSGGAVPDGTAFFASSILHSLVFSASNSVGGWTFKTGASHYTFNVPAGQFLEFTGAGIVIKDGSASIINNQDLHFENSSTAGKGHITNNNITEFNGGSSAGHATITNNNSLTFHVSSTAGAASITNVAGGDIDFYNTSSAGAAHVTNAGDIRFHDTSSASNATFTNAAFGLVQFLDSSNAGHANITSHYVDFFANTTASHAHIAATQLVFYDNTNAGAAAITVAKGAFLAFVDESTGGTARLIAKAGATVDFSRSSGTDNLNLITAGSIEGAGTYKLGGNTLVVGSNNRSTQVSGAIDDGGSNGGSGAVLDKVGTGTLKLSHSNNTYSGGTAIFAGTLDVAAKGAAGTGHIVFFPFVPNHQTLKIENTALTSHVFDTEIDDFHAGDAIDLAGLKFVAGAKAHYDAISLVLTVHSGTVTDKLTLQNPDTGTFKAVDDGHGGTKIVAVVPHAKPTAQTAAEKQASNHHSAANDTAASSVSAVGFRFGDLVGLGRQDEGKLHAGSDLHLTLAVSNDSAAGHNALFGIGNADFQFDMQHNLADDLHSLAKGDLVL